MQPVPLSPGVWTVHAAPAPLFTAGEPDRGWGLERIAEDGDTGPLSSALGGKLGLASGVFNTPDGAGGPGPLGPGVDG